MTSSMNDIMHDLLDKLRIISTIKEDQKLDTSNGRLNIYTEGWLSWIRRNWYGDSKDEGVRYIKDMYKAIQQYVETLIKEYNQTRDESKKSAIITVLINAASELKASIKGLDNLCKTYINFQRTTAELLGILKDYILVTYSSLLDVIPANKLPNDLLTSITYGGIIVFSIKKEEIDVPNSQSDLV